MIPIYEFMRMIRMNSNEKALFVEAFLGIPHKTFVRCNGFLRGVYTIQNEKRCQPEHHAIKCARPAEYDKGRGVSRPLKNLAGIVHSDIRTTTHAVYVAISKYRVKISDLVLVWWSSAFFAICRRLCK